MDRIPSGKVPAGWDAEMLSAGFIYHETVTPEGMKVPYWASNGAHYQLTMAEVELFERACAAIYQMMLAGAEHILKHPQLMRKMAIPEKAFPAIVESWEKNLPNIYGRFDLRYDGNGPPQLLEFNADTPTSLFEASFLQWKWFEYTYQGERKPDGMSPAYDQWNFIEEALIQAWVRNIGLYELQNGDNRRIKRIHFVYTSAETSGEDLVNTAYMADLAYKAATRAAQNKPDYEVAILATEDIGLGEDGRFYDTDGNLMEVIFKLFPWEWLVDEQFGNAVLSSVVAPEPTLWIEPAFKMLWSNKGILPILWQLFKDDPENSQYLLPAYFADEPHGLSDFVVKPLLGREGANVIIVKNGETLAKTGGQYGQEGFVVQQFAPLPKFDTPEGPRHPVFGAWVVDGLVYPGMGIRESAGLITDNGSFFVPHLIAL